MRRYVTLDLETVPDEELVAAVDGEPSRPYADQLGRLLAARRAQSGGRSDFLPIPYHRPVVACALEAVERDGAAIVTDLACWTDRTGSEAAFLERAWERLRGRTLVTFHGRGFDVPVLELRAMKLGVSLPHGGAGERTGVAEHHDLYELLSNGGISPAPLDLYAKLVGLPGKDGVAGKDVGALYAQGDVDRIAGYCMSDVVQTWLLYLRYRLVEGSLSPPAYAASVASCREELPRLFQLRLDPASAALVTPFFARCAAFLGDVPDLPLRRAL